MSKRYTDTEIWENDWFIGLPLKYKMFWLYCKDSCSFIGIWNPKKTMFERLNQVEIDLDEFLKLVNKNKTRVRILKDGRWFIEDFIFFQYSKKIKTGEKNSVYKSIINDLIKNNISLDSIRNVTFYPNDEQLKNLNDCDPCPSLAPATPQSCPSLAPALSVKIKTTDKDKDKDRSFIAKISTPIETTTNTTKDTLVPKETITKQIVTSQIADKAMLNVELEKIPDCLKGFTNWVYWKNTKLEDGKFTKIPYSDIGKPAKTNDSATWKRFQDVKDWKTKGFSGIGYVLTKSDPYVIIDLDDCVEKNGNLSYFAKNVVSYFLSYTEFSPSGKGLHIVLMGKIGKAVKRKEIEIYDCGRYMAFTGNIFLNEEITNRQKELNKTIEKYSKKIRKYIKHDFVINNNGKFILPKETFTEGNRNNELAKWGGVLNSKNLSDNEYWQYLFQINKQCCNPPLHDSEVRIVGQSIRRYKE